MNILIRNLDRGTTEDALYKLFETYGTITSHNIVLDKVSGKSKGFGFIEMPNTKEGSSAIKGLNGKTVNGNRLRVKSSKAKNIDN